MNRVYLTIKIALLIALLPVLASAQPGSAECGLGFGPKGPRRMHKAGLAFQRVLRLKDQIALTAEQVGQLEAIEAEVRSRCQAGAEALKAKKDALHKAVKSGADETAIRAAAAELANAIAEKAILKAATKARVNAVLIDTQKTKLKELKAEHRQRRRQWLAEGGQRMHKGLKDTQEAFTRIDTNGDGSIGIEEFKAHREKMKARHGHKWMRGRQGPPQIE